MPYDVFMKYGSEHAVKEAGRLQVEGKDFVVSDGDILNIRFNV
jgi:ribosome-binding ATPase